MAKRTHSGRRLVIVESPAKARTINKYLGGDFVVKASMGHVRDLPERTLGVDVADRFKPTYEVVKGRTKVIRELKTLADEAPEVLLATDRDREGEAIAWHLCEALNLKPDRARRVIFNEITKSAIVEAFKRPHEIDLDRVNAQQARRILDRIVGYELSPLLWRKIAKGLSAGRVQSVAVRLIVDREREIRAFRPEESWSIAGFVAPPDVNADEIAGRWAEYRKQDRTQKDQQRWLAEHGAFRVEAAELAGAPLRLNNVEDARRVAEALGYRVDRVDQTEWAEYRQFGLKRAALVGSFDVQSRRALTVTDLTTRRTTTRPSAPFTTAALQQAASTTLRFSASRTMRIAQALYEGVDLRGEGAVGLITYMRTDSTNLSGEAIAAARKYVQAQFGERYVPEKPNFFGKRQERAQEAHEAIRPTDVFHTPQAVRDALTDEQFKLYELIWTRFVACQMPPAEWDSTSVQLSADTPAGAVRFTGSGRKLAFDGFMRVAGISSEDQLLPPLSPGASLRLFDLTPTQQFTSPPARYNEASLVKTLEAEGIGRPSTYAAIIDTIQERGYVEQLERKFHPTALGEVVTDKLVAHFPKIMDVKFTSFMEDELDKIEESHLDWVHVLHEFYDPFRELLARAGEEMEAARGQPSEHVCADCGGAMLYRWSRTGRFLACSNYPRCKATMNVDRDGQPVRQVVTDHACEQCGKPMILRRSKSGPFLGCSGYPECRGTRPCDDSGVPLKVVEEDELTAPCEQCGGTMGVKWKGRRAFLGCKNYPTCKHATSLPPGVHVRKKPGPPPEDTGVPCEKCRRPMVIRVGKRGKFLSCSGFPKCRNAKPIEKLEELRAQASASGEPPAPVDETPGRRSRKGAAASAGGDPPPGFAWTRTGRPVVEVMPEPGTLHCPECGETMDLRRGRFGPFFSCTGFPKCKFVSNLRGAAKKEAEELLPAPDRPKPVPTDIACDQCGQPMMIREGRSGRFLGCSGYPKCKNTRELPADLALAEPAAR